MAVILALFIVVPLTVYLGAPPLWSSKVAQRECGEIVENRLGGDPASATVSWVHLPIAHWACATDGRPIADLGWWVTDSSSERVSLEGRGPALGPTTFSLNDHVVGEHPDATFSP